MNTLGYGNSYFCGDQTLHRALSPIPQISLLLLLATLLPFAHPINILIRVVRSRRRRSRHETDENVNSVPMLQTGQSSEVPAADGDVVLTPCTECDASPR